MTKEVMKQALDALINSVDLVTGADAEAVELYSTSRQARIVGLKRELDAHEAAIKALEAAIAQPVSNIAFLYEELRKATDGESESMTHDDALAQIKYWSDMAAIAQPVQPADVTQDAARYRWLRDHENGTCVVNGELLSGEKLDRAVDNLTKETK